MVTFFMCKIRYCLFWFAFIFFDASLIVLFIRFAINRTGMNRYSKTDTKSAMANADFSNQERFIHLIPVNYLLVSN